MEDPSFFDQFEHLFKVKMIYLYIKQHKSFEFLRNEICLLLSSDTVFLTYSEKDQLLNFKNILYLIEQTICKNQNMCFPDFCTQLRGRIIGEKERSLMYMLRLDITNQNCTFFKGFQNSLRENSKIDTIIKLPFTFINQTAFFAEQDKICISTDSGLLIIYSYTTFQVIGLINSKYLNITTMTYYTPQGEDMDEYLLTGGQDPEIRKWDDIESVESSSYSIHDQGVIEI